MAALLKSRLRLLVALPAFSVAVGSRSFCDAAASRGSDLPKDDGDAGASRRGAGMGTVTPWTIPYRERIGIGMSPLIQTLPMFQPWEPPKQGEIKITVEAVFPDTDDETGNYVIDMGYVKAVARNSSGKPLAAAVGSAKFNGKWQLYLYALKAGAVLEKKLEDEGKHIGPVIYETRHVGLGIWFSGMPVDGDDPEDMLSDYMPDDLEEFASSCKILWPPKQKEEEEVMEGRIRAINSGFAAPKM